MHVSVLLNCNMRILPNLFATLIILIFSNSTIAQKLEKVKPTIGIGRLQVSLNKEIPLYRNAKSALPFDTICFSVIESGAQKGEFSIHTKGSMTIKPIAYSHGDSEIEGRKNIDFGLVRFAPHLSFRVLKCFTAGYVIVINEDTYETVIIKKDKYHKEYFVGEPYWDDSHNSSTSDGIWFLYESWEVYLKRMMYITLKKGGNLYDKINGDIMNIEFSSGKVITLKKHWARIKVFPVKGNDQSETAWVKWTDGKKLNINAVAALY